ncbi:MAG: tyrosine-type recombinase/integrase [Thermodesulforhabdaceae bacterium]
MFEAKDPAGPNELVFKYRKHKGEVKSVPSVFYRTVKDLGLNSGVSGRRMQMCFHILRHTFGSWLVMAGVPIYTVRELMG